MVIGEDITLSEIVIRAFLLRHSLLMRLGTGPKVIGSRYNDSTKEILDLLAGNRVAVTWIDVESDPRAETLLRGFGFTVADIPVVIVAGRPILRGSVTGLMTAAGGIGHTLPFLISDFHIAMTFAVAVVGVELAAISYIRHRYMDTPFLSAAFQVVLGGALVFLTGILIGSA